MNPKIPCNCRISIKQIHEYMINRNLTELTKGINQYGSRFWVDYRDWLKNNFRTHIWSKRFDHFTDMTIFYYNVMIG